MLDALACLLCLKLCWHNRRKPNANQEFLPTKSHAGRSFRIVTAKVSQLLLNLSNVLKLQLGLIKHIDTQLDPKSEINEIHEEADYYH